MPPRLKRHGDPESLYEGIIVSQLVEWSSLLLPILLQFFRYSTLGRGLHNWLIRAFRNATYHVSGAVLKSLCIATGGQVDPQDNNGGRDV
jgi:hypothetical protein